MSFESFDDCLLSAFQDMKPLEEGTHKLSK